MFISGDFHRLYFILFYPISFLYSFLFIQDDCDHAGLEQREYGLF